MELFLLYPELIGFFYNIGENINILIKSINLGNTTKRERISPTPSAPTKRKAQKQ